MGFRSIVGWTGKHDFINGILKGELKLLLDWQDK